MKGRILISLFALPFAGVGAFMLYSIGSTLFDASRMSGWQPVEARLTNAGYTSHQGDDSDTYEAYAQYSYSWQGMAYTGDRVGLSGGGDNIGDYQQDIGRELSAALASGNNIIVYVNQDDPREAVIDRGVRWGLIGFKSIFVFVFGGVGVGLLIAIWSAPKEKDKDDPRYTAEPWLLNNDWQTASITSDSKMAMWGAWMFAGFWNAISSFTPFIAWEEVNDGNYIALVALLFPLIGIGLLVWAIRQTREWLRFGRTPVVLDPFPGAIGGHVGGTIDIALPHSSANTFMLTLTNAQSYVSGSGKNRSRRENALWQDESLAFAETGPKGTRLSFRFDVPDGLAESDADTSTDSYKLWRLNLRAELDGTNLNRSFEIPVYATGETSKHLSARAASVAMSSQAAIHDDAIRDVVEVSYDGVGKKLSYSMFRFWWSNLAGTVIGATFAAIGGWLIIEEGQTIFGGIFGSVGLIVALSALYMLFRSLEVVQEGDRIRSITRWLGLPVRTRELRRSEFYRFEKEANRQTQAGNSHVMYYKITAIARDAREIVLGEGFRGASGADAGVRFLERELGLEEQDASSF